MTIGWVMFFKALVLGIGAIFVEKYRRMRLRQRLDGIRLRPNETGVYVADDRLNTFERFLKDLRSWGFMLVYAWWITLALLLFFA